MEYVEEQYSIHYSKYPNIQIGQTQKWQFLNVQVKLRQLPKKHGTLSAAEVFL